VSRHVIAETDNVNNFSVNNRHFVIISSQATQLYITKVPYKQLNCHDYIKNHFSSTG
jgi:hypothetical protein